jgi:oligopeptide/dipeptide ABC transporter ATP-binding protein
MTGPAVTTERVGTEAPLVVRGLSVAFEARGRRDQIVEDVDLSVSQGRTLGLVGESGSGKSVTALALLGLLPRATARVTFDHLTLAGEDMRGATPRDWRRKRGREVAMIFQDPMTSLNPALTIGEQIGESVRLHLRLGRKAARARAVEVLDQVGIPGAARRLDDYPHSFSGGMRQRAMIAMALACRPKVLLADEPTTALDVTVQAQILDLLRELRTELQMAVLLITHDLGVVADSCDEVVVMYAGQLVERAAADQLFDRPLHPYTEALLHSLPERGRPGEALPVMPGVVPTPGNRPAGCRFHPRCRFAEAGSCDTELQALVERGSRLVRCVRADELRLEGDHQT